MRVNMKLHVVFLVVSYLSYCVASSKEPSAAMLRTAYCACRCCEEDSKSCFRHPSLPDNFKCSESSCNEKFCGVWEKVKCSKDCFCEKCKSKLTPMDLRCVSFVKSAEGCKCEEEVDCESEQQPDELSKSIEKMGDALSNSKCIIPCFCKVCKNSVPTALYTDCLKSPQPDKDCDCNQMSCPTNELLDEIENFKAKRDKNRDFKSAEKFSKDIDDSMEPDKARDMKCNMQCYCEKCSTANDKIMNTCEKMLPKPAIEGCNCPDDISCPQEDVDTHCRLYCFCKGCKHDSRMPLQVLKGCQEMTKKDQPCLCEDENCDLLEKLPNDMPSSTDEKDSTVKKTKKGKLKSKKKTKDEL